MLQLMLCALCISMITGVSSVIINTFQVSCSPQITVAHSDKDHYCTVLCFDGNADGRDLTMDVNICIADDDDNSVSDNGLIYPIHSCVGKIYC